MLNCTAEEYSQVGRATTDINDACTQLFLPVTM